MTWANYDDALRQIQGAGLAVTHLDVDTARPVRCRIEGGGREKRGWYCLHDIDLESPKNSGERRRFIVGSFGVWRGAEKNTQKISLSRRLLGVGLNAQTTAAIRARHAESVKRAAAIRVAEQDRAARKAALAWSKYLPSNPNGTLPDYLQRKAVHGHGIRYSPSGNGTIAIPMTDAAGKIWGLQIIRGKNRGHKLEKQYWPAGMNKTGHYHMLGSPGVVILLVEGYATGATIYEATGLCVVVAFDANNLLAVAQALHKTYPHAHILVCADDDYLTEGNPGVASAQNAALAVSGSVVKPQFPADRAGKKLTDFNDLASMPHGGLHVVRAQIEAALAKAGVDLRPARQRASVGGASENANTLDSAFSKGLTEPMQSYELAGGIVEYNRSAIWFYPPPKKEGQRPAPLKLAEQMEVAARTYDAETRKYGFIVRGKTDKGRVIELILPNRICTDGGNALAAELADAGFQIEPLRKQKELLAAHLLRCPVDAEQRLSSRLGWHDEATYLLPDKAITAEGSESEPLAYHSKSTTRTGYGTSGTLDQWRQQIAKPAAGNSRLTLALCTAFAAPLLKAYGIDRGGFLVHLRGNSSSGKTTALNVAASVFGKPSAFAIQWRATANALEGIAESRNDGLLALDEVGQATAKELEPLAYMLANGRGKERANKNADNRISRYWRSISYTNIFIRGNRGNEVTRLFI